MSYWYTDCLSEAATSLCMVDKSLLPDKLLPYIPKIDCYIGGQPFCFQYDDNNDLYEISITPVSYNMEDDANDSEFITCDIQEIENGFIINKSIVLPINHWNTITDLDDEISWCFVCSDVIIDVSTHIATENHIESLNNNMPLRRFDLNIVRTLLTYYHCGVCNETFDILEESHFSSEIHDYHLTVACKKYSNYEREKSEDELSFYSADQSNNNSPTYSVEMESCDTSEIGIVDLSVNRIPDLNESDGFNEALGESKQLSDRLSYANVAATSKNYKINWFGTAYNIDKYYWNMLVQLKTDFYCMCCKLTDAKQEKNEHCLSPTHIETLKRCLPIQDYKNLILRQLDDRFLHCANCNNLVLQHSIAEHIERVHKPKTKLLANNIEEKRKEENDKKITQTATNNIKLSNGERKTNEWNEIKNAEERNTIKHNETENAEKRNTIKHNETENAEKRNTTEHNEVENVDGRKTVDETENDTINRIFFIRVFDVTLKVSLLSYNFIYSTNDDNYCALCNFRFIKNIISHINEPAHRFHLQIPYIVTLGINLIRTVNIRLVTGVVKLSIHCTHCNLIIPNDVVALDHHISNPAHIAKMNASIHTNKTQTSVMDEEREKMTPVNVNTASENVVEEVIEEATAETPSETNNDEMVTPAPSNLSTDNLDTLLKEKCGLDEYFEVMLVCKLKNKMIKLSASSFNAFVLIGNGRCLCFVCSMKVVHSNIHSISDEHLTNLRKCTFIDKYEGNLIRKNKQCYHCAVCNTLILTKKDIQIHLLFPEHINNYSKTTKYRHRELIDVKTVEITMAKEIKKDIFNNKTQIKFHYKFESGTTIVSMKNKIIKQNSNTLKLRWDTWHGLLRVKNGLRCMLCKANLKMYDLGVHVTSTKHSMSVHKIENKYFPNILRKIDEATLNCLTCNSQISSKEHIILSHINSKKHKQSHSDAQISDSREHLEADVILL